jgi:hypothetical protein
MGTYVSQHGRALGFDSDTKQLIRDGRNWDGLTAYTSASSAAIDGYPGVATLSSAATSFTLDPPAFAGAIKHLTTLTTSTLVRAVTRVSTALYIHSTDGSTMVKANFAGQGGSLTLIGLSTSLWGVLNRTSTDTTLTGTS